MFEIKLIFYGLCRMLLFSQFVWPLSYSVWEVFNNFLLIDATDRSKISSDQKHFFIALSLYPLSFFANTPFKYEFRKLFTFNFGFFTKVICAFLLQENMLELSEINTLKYSNVQCTVYSVQCTVYAYLSYHVHLESRHSYLGDEHETKNKA